MTGRVEGQVASESGARRGRGRNPAGHLSTMSGLPAPWGASADVADALLVLASDETLYIARAACRATRDPASSDSARRRRDHPCEV